MASFKLEGNTYFFANGRWLDHNSKQVSDDLAKRLNEVYSSEKIKEKEEKQMKLSQIAKKMEKRYGSYSKESYSSGIKHKVAIERRYEKPVELTLEQKKALDLLESGDNVFLSGEAGTGKSFVLNEFIRRAKNKNIMVCAPTGIAAINIGGTTLHRAFEIPIGPLKPGQYNSKPSEAIIKADIIIIDEISMCRFDTFEFVIKTIRNAEVICQNKKNIEALNNGENPELLKPKQIIVVGDFYQLPPVIMPKHKEILDVYWGAEITKEGFAFQADSWDELCFKNIILKEVVRQRGSKEFLTNLNLIRKGNASGIDWFNRNASKIPVEESIYLCPTNRQADSINREKSEALPGDAVIYRAEVIGEVQESDKVTHDELALKIGMQVMTLVNNHEEGYKNGSIGRVVALEDDLVKVELNTGVQVDVRVYDWEIYGYEIQDEKLVKVVLGNYKQIPLKIAYAITIHKSQGQTYSSANISPNCFAAGQLYVALSRVEKIEEMSLEYDIRPNALIVSNSVKQFYEGLIEVLM